LVAICERELIKSISLDNAIDVLQAADLIDRKLLKDTAVAFIAKHIKVLIDTPKWAQVIETSIPFLSTLLRKVI
jgi:hypothetical protein